MFQRILNITFLLLLSVWLFGTYKFSNQNDNRLTQQDSYSDTVSTSTPEATSATSTIIKIFTETSSSTEKTKKAVVSVKKPEQATTTPTLPPEPTPDFAQINKDARLATVNIMCIAKTSDMSPISGTGIMISPEGVILTNAHVGQYFLLKNFSQKDFMNCVIRTGSPAYPRYHAELAYLSQEWAEENKTILKSQDPKGTGQFDFAFLRITDAIDGSPLPSFDYILPNISEWIPKGKPVLLAGYPAGFLGGIAILQGISVTTAQTTIQDVFTFSANKIDILAVGGTVLSQKGASGGGVIDGKTTLLGIISTSSNADKTGDRNLNAISLGYINRTLQDEIGMNLYQFLTQDVKNFAKSFNETKAPELLKTITEVFNTN